MSEQPRVGDRVRVRARAFDGELVELDGNSGVVLDENGDRRLFRMPFCSVEVIEPPRCRATEGATGIECGLAKGHPIDVDHEGTHVPNESCDYPLFVRWPWQTYDPGFADAMPPLVDAGPGNRPAVPRVFSSDGPEPPSDVTVLEWIDRQNLTQYQFLIRSEPGWLWSEISNALSPMRPVAPNDWRGATLSSPGRYREVLP